MILATADSHCHHNFTNIIGSGERAIEFYNYSTTIQDNELSELILCNADNSIVDNVTIKGSDTLQNNFLQLVYSDNVTISNINFSGNYLSIHLRNSDNNTLINITANSNDNGIDFYSSSNNILQNITANNNTGDGKYIN